MTPPPLLDGKVVLVTGAGQGIGRAHALTLAALGARIVANDLATSPSLESLGERLAAQGREVVLDRSDISTWDGARAAVRHGIEALGRLDGIINNAGIVGPADLADLDETTLDGVIGVNLKGAFGVVHHASEHWRAEHRAGRTPRAAVVNTASDVVLTAAPGASAYAATKAALVALTQTGSIEGAHYGVRHNAIAPSAHTPQSAGSGHLGTERDPVPHPEDQDPASPVNPLHNSPLVAWLLSDRAAHVTGQVFRMRFGAFSRVVPLDFGAWHRPAGGAPAWDPELLAEEMDAHVFGSRFPAPMRTFPDRPSEPFMRMDHG